MGVRVCIVGGGVVGFTTATLLQASLPPDASITLIADKFFQNTTSNGAAGIYRPGLQFQGPTPEITRQWLQDSYDYYKTILNSPEASIAGVKKLSGYHFSNDYPNIVWNELLKPILEVYRSCTQEELKTHGFKYGTFASTLLTDCTYYLPFLSRRFVSNGGVIEERHLNSLEELAGKYDVVCNCTGFGAKDLVGDRTVTPIRGQVYKVYAPWVKNFYYNDYDTYILPGMDYVTLGGTRQFDSYNAKVNKYDSKAIWERAVDLVPSLKDAKVVTEWVGWRPYRPIVRVEKERMSFESGKTLKVVHNYGHGGYGVMTAPGTSMHAVRFVKQFLDEPKAKL